MKKTGFVFAFVLSMLCLLIGCGNNKDAAKTPETKKEAKAESQVASADEMVTPEEVVEEGMEPFSADKIKDGTYSVTVDSSSSMFKITSCELTVSNKEMTAVMTMSGTGYRYLYMGTAEEAAVAAEKEYIPFVENQNGEHTFTVPVEALDMGINCAAFSKNKEKWYDRVLVFRKDSLPTEAFEAEAVTTVESLGLADGVYQAEVTLEGGSGKASVQSPAKLTVTDGKMTATIVWSSSNYDYMKVGEQRYDFVNTEGNSTFEIPVTVLDSRMAVIADTIAMSQPHEIEYTLYFDSKTITKAEE